MNKTGFQDGVGTLIVLIWNNSTENLDFLDKIIAPETRNKCSLYCPNTMLFPKLTQTELQYDEIQFVTYTIPFVQSKLACLHSHCILSLVS